MLRYLSKKTIQLQRHQLRWMNLKALTDALKISILHFIDLVNLVTWRVASDVVRDDVCRMIAVGTEQYLPNRDSGFLPNRDSGLEYIGSA